MSNFNIKEYLDFYTKHEKPLEYAILLDGQWGSGKTHFIKNYMTENDPKNFLYVSLYGINTISEIEDQFFQQLHPFLSSKPFSIGAKILKGSLKIGFNFDLDGGDKKDDGANADLTATGVGIEDFINNSTTRVIVFDDLERCEMSINKILGYMNHLVEHQKSRVIILGHEEKIIPKKDSDEYFKYNEIKEKLIGRTFSVSADFENALKNFVSNVQDPNAKKVLEDNTQNITYTYKSIGYQNLRSLRQAVDEFERLYLILPAKAKESKELLSELINLLMVFVFEIRNGLLIATDIQNISTASISSLSEKIGIKNDKNDELSNRDKFLKKHEAINFYEMCPSDDCWFDFFKYGTVEVKKLEVSIQNSKFFRHENIQEWVKLWHYRDLEEKEFNEVFAQVKDKFEKLEYKKPGILKHVAGLLFRFSKDGIINDSLDSIRTYVKGIYKKLHDGELIVYEENEFDISRGAYASLVFAENKLAEFKEISDELDVYTKAVKEKNYPIQAEELLGYVKNNSRKFWEALSTKMASGSKLYNIPILKYIEPEKFVTEYLACPNESKDMIGYAFKDRYELVLHYPALREEGEWLSKIDKILDEIEKKESPFNRFTINCFREYTLKKAIKDLLEPAKEI